MADEGGKPIACGKRHGGHLLSLCFFFVLFCFVLFRNGRPSNAHIMVSNQEAASAWGTACSVWPLGDSLDYSWFDNCSELRVNPFPSGLRIRSSAKGSTSVRVVGFADDENLWKFSTGVGG